MARKERQKSEPEETGSCYLASHFPVAYNLFQRIFFVSNYCAIQTGNFASIKRLGRVKQVVNTVLLICFNKSFRRQGLPALDNAIDDSFHKGLYQWPQNKFSTMQVQLRISCDDQRVLRQAILF